MAKHKATESITPDDVAAIRREIRAFFSQTDSRGRKIGSATYGVYLFYDFDGEPIYVGQTREKLSGRVSRHLTNRRTDAVAMNVLDPVEVAEIEVWPLDDLIARLPKVPKKPWEAAVKLTLDRVESRVFHQALAASRFRAVLNEKTIPRPDKIKLPAAFRGSIIPKDLVRQRKHPDVRIARRAATIAALARIISEREVSIGLRRTLLTQAQRLEHLARERLKELGIRFSNLKDEAS